MTDYRVTTLDIDGLATQVLDGSATVDEGSWIGSVLGPGAVALRSRSQQPSKVRVRLGARVLTGEAIIFSIGLNARAEGVRTRIDLRSSSDAFEVS